MNAKNFWPTLRFVAFGLHGKVFEDEVTHDLLLEDLLLRAPNLKSFQTLHSPSSQCCESAVSLEAQITKGVPEVWQVRRGATFLDEHMFKGLSLAEEEIDKAILVADRLTPAVRNGVQALILITHPVHITHLPGLLFEESFPENSTAYQALVDQYRNLMYASEFFVFDLHENTAWYVRSNDLV